MKLIFKISFLIFALFFSYSCKKDKPTIPVLTTKSVTEVTTTAAVSGGDITDKGGVTIISSGVCWNTSTDPTIDNNKTSDATGSASFTSNISQLSPNTTYYVRAYATNSVGTGYGKTLSFKTLGDKPASAAVNASNIQVTTATLNGTVNSNSLSTAVTFEYGTTISYGSTSIARQSPITGNSAADVSADLTGLTAGTTYHFRVKAENSLGITYSTDLTFTTLGQSPAVTSQPATSIQLNTATLNGTVNPNYLSTTASFEWGLTTSYGNTATATQSPVTGSTAVSISANLTGLNPGTTYHFRIKGENSVGISYTSDQTFKTLGQVPTATTLAATNIQIKSATLNASVNPNYLSSTATFEWGTTTGYGNTIAVGQIPGTGNNALTISSDLTGLTPGTTYHFRIKAENSLGITYSSDMPFTTLGQVPTAATPTATNLQLNSATVNGSVNPNYLSTTTTFEWGSNTSYGNTVAGTPDPVTGNSAVNISANLSALAPGTTYHFRIKAINELGTIYSNDYTFTTLGQVPAANPLDATNLQVNRARINGSVNANYLSTTASFEWGTTTGYGNTVAGTPGTVTGNTLVNIGADLSGLTPGTTYHFRIKAVNILGTTYSNDLTFTTLIPITDIEGNSYGIMTIGTQVWMTENLKTTKYSNGDLIGTTSPPTLDISGEAAPKYQWAYNADDTNVPIYGRLYTGYAATDSRNVCPVGWHVPTDGEWTKLTDYLTNNGYGFEGSGNDIGKSMASMSLWNSDPTPGNVGNDIANNNLSGFDALPAGHRSNDMAVDGSFSTLGYFTAFWSSTDLTSNISWQRILFYSQSIINRTYSGGKQYAVSIRCIKN